MGEGQADDQPIYEFVLNWSKDCRIVQLFQFQWTFFHLPRKGQQEHWWITIPSIWITKANLCYITLVLSFKLSIHRNKRRFTKLKFIAPLYVLYLHRPRFSEKEIPSFPQIFHSWEEVWQKRLSNFCKLQFSIDEIYLYIKKKTIWHIGIWQNRCFGHFLSNNNEVLPNCSIFCPSERKFEGKRDFFSRKSRPKSSLLEM